MSGHRKIEELGEFAGRTIEFAAIVDVPYPLMGCRDRDLAIRFKDGSYAVLHGYGNDCNGGVSPDSTVRDAHRHALGLMTDAERAAYESKIERDRVDEEQADRRDLARLQAKLGTKGR